jgi:hypothetical protein
MRSRVMAGCLLVALPVACVKDSEKSAGAERQIFQADATRVVHPAPYEQIGPIEYDSFTGMNPPLVYLTVRIFISPGYTEKEVRETLKQVAERTAEEKEPTEVRVFAYRSRADISGSFNVGRAEWQSANNVDPIRLSIDMDPDYSAAKKDVTPVVEGSPAFSGITVVRETYGAQWPFPKFDSATLGCETKVFRGVLRPFKTIELGGTRYGFNTTAVKVGGFPRLTKEVVTFDSPSKIWSSEPTVLDELSMKSGDLCGLGPG